MSIARTSHRQSACLFPQLHNWHTTIVCAKDVVRERDRTCHAHGQWLFARIGKHHEEFGTAEVKRAVLRSRALGCRAFAALNEGVAQDS